MTAPETRIETLGKRPLRIGVWKPRRTSDLPPLVMIGGIGLNMELLSPMASRLGDRLILTLEPPGIGGSPDTWRPYTPWGAASWIADLLDLHGIGEADVLGFSWGGAIAQQFAIQHKRRVRRLALAGIGAGWPILPGQVSILSWLTDPHWLRQLRADPRRAAFIGISEADRQALNAEFLARLKLPRTRGYLFQLGALTGWSSALALPFLNRPVLVMMGSQDQVVPLANGKFLSALIPGAQLHVVKGAGHLFMFSHIEVVAAHLRRFLGSDKQAQTRAA